MPFSQEDEFFGPLALPREIKPLMEQEQTSFSDVFAAGFRRESPVVSALTRERPDPEGEFDPDLSVFDEIQGTQFERFADRFIGVRTRPQLEAKKLQIERELEDEATLDAAGALGYAARFAGALLSPTTLLPGGAIVRGAKTGVSIGKTSLTVAENTGIAVAIDEAALQATQEIRSFEESAFAIGGGVILGSALGAGAGKLGARQFKANAKRLEDAMEAVVGLDEAIRGPRSIGAAETAVDLTVRNEGVFRAIRKVPVVGRTLVGSDPLLRTVLSENREVRSAASRLAEPVLEMEVNAQGQTALVGRAPVETRVKTRRQNELAGLFSDFTRFYAEYERDGPVGLVGRMTAPITGKWGHLIGRDRKLSAQEFATEVARAARSTEKHPIPQVQSVADTIQRKFFDPIGNELEELGMIPEGTTLKNSGSYVSRIYNVEKINQHFGSGSPDDIVPVLEAEFQRKRSEAQLRLQQDDTVDRLEGVKFQLREQSRTAQTAFNRAVRKAKEKRGRAEGAVKREGAVGRATAALRKVFSDRSDRLDETVIGTEERAALQEAINDVRSLKRLEPPDLLKTIRDLGGIRDDGSGELQAALDTKLPTIKRADGLSPDDMRSALSELGFIDDGMTVNEFFAALREAASGRKIFSRQESGADVARFEAAQEFADILDELGIDPTQPLDKIIKELPGKARNQKVTAAKAGEAARSADKAGAKADGAEARVLKALDRLENAQARLAELDEVVAPKVRAEIKAANEELKKVIPELKKAQKVRDEDEFFANQTDAEIGTAVRETIQSIKGLKPGESAWRAALANPTRARVLDVSDEVLEPWLESDMRVILSRYFETVVPDMEIIREFGDLEMTDALRRINEEETRLLEAAKSQKARSRISKDAKSQSEDLQDMRDRIRNVYKLPKNPRAWWIVGGRIGRTLSYTSLLGGFVLSALPDLGSLVGRTGIEALGGSVTALTNPKRFGMASKAAMDDFGAAAEWYLNGRAMEIANLADPYSAMGGFERGLGEVGRGFSYVAGVIPWNAGWKTVGGAFIASRLTKAAAAVKAGKATERQLRQLSSNFIDIPTAERIATQMERFGDTDGTLWIPQAGKWDDPEAFRAMQDAMTREFDLMVITPGQDQPLAFGGDGGKFFLQFKSFSFTAYHRVLLSGIQRADADVLAGFSTMLLLGALVSNLKAEVGGFEKKEGAALWVDALDRSGLAGWLFEVYNPVNAIAGGRLAPGGEITSRFQTRATLSGAFGPTVDIALSFGEGVTALSNKAAGTGNLTHSDIRKLIRPVPGNNLILAQILGLTDKIEDEVGNVLGAEPRK